jgi:DNA-directed RNA polymerase subunit RPC12/RpoP
MNCPNCTSKEIDTIGASGTPFYVCRKCGTAFEADGSRTHFTL